MEFLQRNVMEKIDDYVTERIGLEPLMQLAGKRLAEFLTTVSTLDLSKGITLLWGRGPNGGAGLFCLLYLLEEFGYSGKISILPAWDITEKPHGIDFVDNAFATHDLGKKMVHTLPADGVIIDALLDYKLDSSPRDTYSLLITEANLSGLPIVSLDVPSGLNTSTGIFYSSYIRANFVLSLDVPKYGLENSDVNIFVADLGFLDSDYSRFGIEYKRPFGDDKSIISL
ncbi:MAG: hydroxyethylthiazole kinase-like uncharacterized protein yjeF [Patescibacteria group bacterium]|jgi:hydroxyethylthiazole kinase-like uncharacterized protein yjeF